MNRWEEIEKMERRWLEAAYWARWRRWVLTIAFLIALAVVAAALFGRPA
jgi:hypothetical protein